MCISKKQLKNWLSRKRGPITIWIAFITFGSMIFFPSLKEYVIQIKEVLFIALIPTLILSAIVWYGIKMVILKASLSPEEISLIIAILAVLIGVSS